MIDQTTAVLVQTISSTIQALVVTITLFFLIREYVRLKRETRIANYTKQIELINELRLLRIQDPELSKIYESELISNSKKYSKEHFFNLIVLSIFEVTYMKYKEKIIDRETWGFWKETLRVIAKEKTFRQMMDKEQHKIVNPEFLKIVYEIMEEK